MLIPCRHCKNNPAFGRFRVETTKWTPTGIATVYLDWDLCADCGFHITDFARVKVANFDEEVAGKKQHREFVYRIKPFSKVTLLEVHEETRQMALMRQEQERREREMVLQARKEAMDRGDRRREGRTAREPLEVVHVGGASPRRAAESSLRGVVAPHPPPRLRCLLSPRSGA